MTFDNVPVTLYYFILRKKPVTLARGENVKLLLEDAGIKHEYVRVTHEEWKTLSDELAEAGNYTRTLPALKIGDKVYGNAVPIMRYVSKKLGKYIASNPEEEQTLDALSDGLNDWFDKMKGQYFDVKEKHFENVTNKYLNRFEVVYEKKEGPYILGKEITYVDFLVYHLIDDEGVSDSQLEAFPNLHKFVKTFRERPNIKKYLLEVKGKTCPE